MEIKKSSDISKVGDSIGPYSELFPKLQERIEENVTKFTQVIFDVLRYLPSLTDFVDKWERNYKRFEVVFPPGVLIHEITIPRSFC